MSYLQIANLRKSFGATEVLKGIDLEVAKGEFISLLGASGSGKTTILRCIAGLETPNGGAISLDGREIAGPHHFIKAESRNLGMVFQNYAVWPHMDVSANIAFPLKVRGGTARAAIQAKVTEVLKLVRMENLAHRYAHELSGGQQQRVALARALAMSPKALLLDEPLSNLDALLREELGAEIRRLQQELGLTTILVTHDQKEALSLSDRIILLNQGRIEAQGSPEDLYFRPPTPYAASFISGAQQIGAGEPVLPRRWRLSESGEELQVVSRLFLGSEYDYWVERPGDRQRIRFFAQAKLEIGQRVRLVYDK